MNKDIVQGKWKEIKGDLHKTWGNITDDEWEKTKGDATAIAGVLQQKLGYAKDEASKKVAGIMNKYTSETRKAIDDEKSPPSRHK